MALFIELISTNLVLIIWGSALLFVPMILRWIILHLALSYGARKYKARIAQDMGREWQTAKDRMISKKMLELLKIRLRQPLQLTRSLQEDIYSLLKLIDENCDPKGKRGDQQLEFQFSVKKLLQVTFLAFNDTYEELESQWLFRVIKGRKLFWFRGFFTVGNYYKKILDSIPVLRPFTRTPLGGFLIRLFFIPLFGIPSLIWYNLRTLMVGIIAEGSFRFFYVSIVLRITRYGLYLYGEPNPEIEKKLENIQKKGLEKRIEALKEQLDDLSLKRTSKLFPDALLLYQNLLEQFKLNEDEFWKKNEQEELPYSSKNFLEKLGLFFSSHKKDIKVQESFYISLFYQLPEAYGFKGKYNYLRLSVEDSIRLGYLLSLQGIYYILTTPGLEQASTVSLDFIFKLQSISKEPWIADLLPPAREAYNQWRIFSRVRKVLRFVSRRTGAYSLAWSMSSPLLWKNIQKGFSSFIAHRFGRTLLLLWEDRYLGRKRPMSVYFNKGGDDETAKNE